ncbi:MAG: extracellular solute-binding protein, partial [Deltaproteobacteria bacterium]|nr:extracellular solute-binding protein [Deltaproteobacteria bacterium]
MGRRISIVATACCLALAIVASSRAAEKLVLYTSVREPLLGAVCEAFAKAYPDVELNVLSAGAGRLTEKIREQRGNGKIVADVLWSTGIPAFFQFQGEGVLKPYSAPSHGGRIDPFAGEGRGFTAVFFEALGVLYNPRLVKKPPRTWEDVLDKEYTGVFGIADPMVSGTAFIGISLLVKQYGWDFLQKMLANKAKIGKSASLVAQDVAEGELVAGMAVDYMALGKIKRDGTIACVFPRNYLVTPSAVGI